MKATIAVLCFLVALAYAIVVEAQMGQPIDNGPLNPLCEKPPSNCLGNASYAYVYNRTKGCYSVGLSEGCGNNGYYTTPQDCHQYCLPPPGRQGGRRI
uniref:Putative secreted protein n=1 Tax=Ixodes scapularis TaxID=6945 RepID=Q8MVC9_IXOSC|nr:putative secreted protein [Ixodes scapularis]